MNSAVVYRVHFTSSGSFNFEHLVSAEPLVIGRSPKADIVLAEDSVSRRHAQVFVSGAGLHIADLGSSNGVVVNGACVAEHVLAPGDLVQIGCYTMQAEPLNPAAQQKLRRRTEIEHTQVVPIHERLVEEAGNSAVSFLYRVSQCLYAHRELQPLLEGVLAAVMDHLPAERGYILTRRDPKDTVKLAVSQARLPEDAAPPVSHTLVDHVLESRASVLTEDATQDDRFEGSDSIAAYAIKAVICVPLLGHEAVYGAIYLDSSALPAPPTQQHLQLLSIAGQIVGAGVENIVLAERQIRRERLAGIGETVSATSHDMRNILMGISGGVDMIGLACEEENWDEVRSGVAVIRQSLGRFDQLVDSLLMYARDVELNAEEADLGMLVHEVIGAVEAEAKKRRIRLLFDSRPIAPVVIDTQQVYRVLLNLVKNAMEAMDDESGEIRIESGSEAGAAYLRVRDSGCGIAVENLQKVGQPFFTTKKGSGTGLGLAICYRIMAQHRGRIDVDSTPGQGTTFTLVFPPDKTSTRYDPVPE